MIYHKIQHSTTQISPWTVTDCPHGFQNLTTRFQDLEPIKRPPTASFNSNIHKVLKRVNKTKWGETPTSRSLSKLPKSDTHANPSPRRAVLLLVPKTADGRIARIYREKCPLSLKSSQKWVLEIKIYSPRFFGFVLIGEEGSCSIFCLLVT